MSGESATAAVGQSCTPIALPATESVTVLNSSGGVGDSPDAPDVVVSVGAPAQLSPRVGILLTPGSFAELSLVSPTEAAPLALSAVAAGPGGELTLEIRGRCGPDVDEDC